MRTTIVNSFPRQSSTIIRYSRVFSAMRAAREISAAGSDRIGRISGGSFNRDNCQTLFTLLVVAVRLAGKLVSGLISKHVGADSDDGYEGGWAPKVEAHPSNRLRKLVSSICNNRSRSPLPLPLRPENVFCSSALVCAVRFIHGSRLRISNNEL